MMKGGYKIMDIYEKNKRSEIMKNVISRNNKSEILIRKMLFSMGVRYLLHDKRLPGTPDIVLPKYKSVIFINGCMWHGHNCSRGATPKSNIKYWKDKIDKNKDRDEKNILDLLSLDWRVIIIWECSFRGLGKDKLFTLANECYNFFISKRNYMELDISFKKLINKQKIKKHH